MLYPPAVAAVTRWWSPRHVPALTALTVAGGLASTVFAPLSAAIVQRSDWRTTFLVLAVVLAVPAHLLGLRGPWPAVAAELLPDGEVAPGRIARGRPFVRGGVRPARSHRRRRRCAGGGRVTYDAR